MIADAISHAVLPGIFIAYWLAETRSSVPMLIGAAGVGMLTTIAIELLHKKAKLQSDAAIGVTFTFLFAIGIILISAFAGQVDLDQDCVLYGEIAYVPLDTWQLNGINMGPEAIWLLGGLVIVVIASVILFFRPLMITSFDPVFAASLGISVSLWHFVLMGLVSVTTVLSFESVGAILVIAFIIGPAASAYLITHKLRLMLLFAVIIGVAAAVSGYLMAVILDASIAGSMAACIGILFVLCLSYHLYSKNSMQSGIVNPGTGKMELKP